jgi:putative DNA primase/helicase
MNDAKYELANFRGARLVTAVEPKKAGHLDEEVLKQVTGGDTIMARQIYQEPIAYRPEFKLWLAMNNRPRIIGTDEGIWRRVRMIPFKVRIPEERKVKDYHKVLFTEEGPGILNRLLEGVQAWRAEGLKPSGAVKRETDEFRAEQNVIQGYFDTYTLSAKSNQHAKAGDLYASYKQWAEENDEYAIRQNEFAVELERRGYTKRRVRDDGFHWFGITLKAAPAEAENGEALCFEEENV